VGLRISFQEELQPRVQQLIHVIVWRKRAGDLDESGVQVNIAFGGSFRFAYHPASLFFTFHIAKKDDGGTRNTVNVKLYVALLVDQPGADGEVFCPFSCFACGAAAARLWLHMFVCRLFLGRLHDYRRVRRFLHRTRSASSSASPSSRALFGRRFSWLSR